MPKPKLKGPGPGRLPDLSRLVDKSPEQLVSTLERFGLEPNVREIEKRARRAYETQLQAAIEELGEPDKHTWAAIDSQIERELIGVLRQQTKQAIHSYRKMRLEDVAQYFVWIAVGDGSCPSCEERHGRRKTMRQWEQVGEPGSAVLICRKECRCSLQPDFVADPDDVSDQLGKTFEGLRVERGT